jgi:biotin carboxyl carrier protein
LPIVIRIDGREVQPAAASLLEIAHGLFSAVLDGNSYEIRISQNEATVNGHRYRFETEDPRQWKPSRTAASANAPAEILAPMPGKVVRILVALNDLVKAGQGIVVIEAMKMQNELKSPRDGRVTAVKAVPNESVNRGAFLALIEPAL